MRRRGPGRDKDSSGFQLILHLPALAGIVALLAVYVLLTRADLCSARKTIENTMSFLNSRCISYDGQIADDETKSLVRLLDKTLELSQRLQVQGADEALLEQYCYDQRLTGVVLLNGDMEIQTAVGSQTGMWNGILREKAVASVAEHPEKVYLDCMEQRDGKQYDHVAVPRLDGGGLILAYGKKEERSAGLDRVGGLFRGDTFALESVVIIADQDRILNSNDVQLVGRNVDECSLLDRDGWQGGTSDGLQRANFRGGVWYGRTSRCRSYDLYVFAPEKEVFHDRSTVVLCGALIYVIVLVLAALLRQRVQQSHAQALNEQYRLVSAIGEVFSANFLVDLRRNEIRTLKGVERLETLCTSAKSAEAALAEMTDQYIAPDFRDGHRAFTDLTSMDARLEGKSYLSFTYQGIDGRWYHSMLIPQCRDETGRLAAVVLPTRDITEEKRKELEYQQELRETAQRAERADIAKTDFLRRMSHDIRTPINGIRGMVEIGDHFADDLDKQKECRQKIWTASGCLLELVNDVLDMNKLESGSVKLADEPFDLFQVLDECSTLVETQARERGIRFTHEERQVVHRWVRGSPAHLRRILVNIMSNAVKYNRPNGSVTVACVELEGQAPEDWARFRFLCADTGQGMSEEFQKHAFEPFAQEDGSRRSTYRGTGLGLVIAKELVELMGGTISFHSRKEEGTTFTIEIPLRKDLEKRGQPPTLSTMEEDLHGVRVLVAEDNELNMEIAEFILQEQGIQVQKAWNGREAVEAFAASDPGSTALILMDLMMPEMDGVTAARTIRSMDRPDAGTIPIIAMTANAFTDDVERCLAAGMDEHISKPLDTAKLTAAVSRYIRAGRARA